MAFTETHQPCPDCNSSDGLAYNDDGSSKCFVCDAYTPADKVDNIRELGSISDKPKPSFTPDRTPFNHSGVPYHHRPFNNRNDGEEVRSTQAG